MSPLAFVDYGFIIVFFAVLLGAVLLMALHQEKKADIWEHSIMSQQQKQNVLGYGVIAALFAIFILITFLTHRVPGSST